jgi:hypothetical protein
MQCSNGAQLRPSHSVPAQSDSFDGDSFHLGLQMPEEHHFRELYRRAKPVPSLPSRRCGPSYRFEQMSTAMPIQPFSAPSASG